jgi:hypothetical protein
MPEPMPNSRLGSLLIIFPSLMPAIATVQLLTMFCAKRQNCQKSAKPAAEHAVDFEPPIYNVWKQQTKSFGRILWTPPRLGAEIETAKLPFGSCLEIPEN